MKKKPCKHEHMYLSHISQGTDKPRWRLFCRTPSCKHTRKLTTDESSMIDSAFNIGQGRGYDKCREELREAVRRVKAMVNL